MASAAFHLAKLLAHTFCVWCFDKRARAVPIVGLYFFAHLMYKFFVGAEFDRHGLISPPEKSEGTR